MSGAYRERLLRVRPLLEKRSLFLFGPRQTGKSSLIRHELNGIRTYNLLKSEVYLALSRSPELLRQEIAPDERIVVIDEIQKIPALLDEVHVLIEERGIHFLLTGSSARKLRRGGVNLLGGRARSRHLHPFVSAELGKDFDLQRAVNRGLLPSIWDSDSPDEDLRAYIGDYLQLEIAAEGLTRNIPAFSRFLETAALCNGQLLNYAALASDAQVAKTTLREYFQILQDTLLAWELPAWTGSRKRKAIETSKYYFFDTGVTRTLQGRGQVAPRSPEFGELFETWVHHELRTLLDARGTGSLHYWRSTSGFEVDFILNGEIAIECKSKAALTDRDLRGIRALMVEKKMKRYWVVTLEARSRRTSDGIEMMPWARFCERLWEGV